MTAGILHAAWLLVAVAAGFAAADDLSPPPWRGEAGATFRSWGFPGNQTESAPGVTSVTGDGALALVEPEPVFATGWYDTQPGGGVQQGFWDIARGRISLSIPVTPGTAALEIRIQVTWLEGINGVPAISIPGGVRGEVADVLVEEVPPFERWKSRVETWSLASPPAQLAVTINGNAASGSQIDYISVDMRAMPSAASPFDAWAAAGGLDGSAGKENGPGDDPDRDGAPNLLEFALGSPPLDGSPPPQASYRTIDGFVYTIPVRATAPAFTGEIAAGATVEGIHYQVEGSATLDGFTLPVIAVAPVTDGLPPAPAGYAYRSFRLAGEPPHTGFMRLRVSAP